MISAPVTQMSKVRQYVDSVLSGARVCGRKERQAVDRYISERERARTDKDYPFGFDEDLACLAMDFFPLLKHTDGEYVDTPFELYPWQAFVVANLFGWVRKDSGFRRYRKAFLSMGRGNGKTPFGAALMLLLLAFDTPQEARAEVYTAAVKRDQAGLSFKAAKNLVIKSQLEGPIRVMEKKLVVRDNQSELSALSSDGKSADGLNIHGLLRDELHAWSDYYRDFVEKLSTAMGKRRQPLEITITTAGSEESTLWREEYELMARILDPAQEFDMPSTFAFIAEIDDEDDELDESVWPKANPMLEYGVVKVDYLREMAKKSEVDATARHQMRRYHCNKLTYSSRKTFTHEMWARGDAVPDLSRVKEIYAGVDLGWCDDFAAVGYVAPLDWVSLAGESKRRYAIWSEVLIPKMTKRNLNEEPFLSWIANGRVHVTDSEWTDTEPLYASLRDNKKRFRIKSCGYDPNNAREFATNCTNKLGLTMQPLGQNHAKYHEPFREFKQALSEGRILHGGEKVIGWAAQNVVEDTNHAMHTMPSKKRSQDKIDPFVAVLMAFNEALFAARQKPSKYEKVDPITIGFSDAS